MEQKKCTGKNGCSEIKDIAQFPKHGNQCKKCRSARNKKWREEHPEEIKKYREGHKKEQKEYNRKYREEHPREQEEYDKKYYQEHQEEKLVYSKTYREEHPEKTKKCKKKYREKHQKEIREYDIKWREEHTEEIKKYKKKYHQERMQNDPIYKLRFILNAHFHNFIKGIEYPSQTFKDFIGALYYDRYELLVHIESQFPKYLDHNGKPWMTWKNHGVYIRDKWEDDDSSTWVWHIDHEIPKSQLPFESFEEENFKKCWELKNLRPYPGKQNVKEGNRKVKK